MSKSRRQVYKPKDNDALGDVDLSAAATKAAFNVRTVDEFVVEIKQTWQNSVTAIIKTGQLLQEAKDSLKHGEWTQMFTDGKLPFSERTAQRLMKIAAHPILSNPTHVSLLPPSWGTLHALAQLSVEVLEEMIADGTLNCEIERKTVDEIRLKIGEEGTYIWVDLRHALNEQIKFMQRWPQPDQIAQHVWGKDDEVALEYVDTEQLGTLSTWIANLANECQRQEEKAVQEMEKWEEQREQEEKAEAKAEAEARAERIKNLRTPEATKQRKGISDELRWQREHNDMMRSTAKKRQKRRAAMSTE